MEKVRESQGMEMVMENVSDQGISGKVREYQGKSGNIRELYVT